MSAATPFENLVIRPHATFSACGAYRFTLSRSWGDCHEPWLGWIMLNPSTADAEQDDPTIRRCMRFAHRLGYSGIAVMNYFSLRATDPAELDTHPAPVAPLPVSPTHDYDLIGSIWELCPMVIAAWGSHDIVAKYDTAAAMRRLCTARRQVLHCLAVNADGNPRHPLYVKGDTQPLIWFDGRGDASPA